MRLTIAVDFDGVIHKYRAGWRDGSIYDEPVEGVKAALTYLRECGHEIVIYTCRANRHIMTDAFQPHDQAPQIAGWMRDHGLPFDRIEGEGKPMAHAYIDDLGIRFLHWPQVLHDLRRFVPKGSFPEPVAQADGASE